MHKGLREPHVLLASSNPHKLMRNLRGVLEQGELAKIEAEVDRNAIALFRLGEGHLRFASAIASSEWRQRISRYYYAAYNVKRAVSLKTDGSFSTDASDHQKIDTLPGGFPDQGRFGTQLRNLRDYRNLADYSHQAQAGDLLLPPDDCATLVTEFVNAARAYLNFRGLAV